MNAVSRLLLLRTTALAFGALGFFGLTGCGRKDVGTSQTADGKTLVKVSIQTDWYAQPEHGGFYQAIEKGYYREVGLDVEIVPGGPNAIPPQKVALGQSQFGIGRSDDTSVAISRGIPVVMVGALMQRDPQALMFHKESGIKGFADLNGRSVMAVPGAGFIPLLEKKYGIKISITPLDFGLSRFMADKNFVQQCFITNEPFYVKQQGANPGVLLLSEMGFSPYRIWYTSRDFLKKHPDLVRAFTVASIRGWRDYMEGDRSAADAKIGRLNKQMTTEFIAYSVGAMKEYKLVAGDPAKGETIGQIDPKRIAGELKQLHEIGILSRPMKPEDVFDESVLPEDVRAR
ncbi:MAG: ABC transporter substrate-binding protein [Opitutus sp.]